MALSWLHLVLRSPKNALAVVRRKNEDLKDTDVLSADTLIKSGGGDVYQLTVSDTAALAIELNDSIINNGADKWGIDLPADGYAHFIFDPPKNFKNGIYLNVSTATCKVSISYI